MKITRKYGKSKVEIDTDKMTDKQKTIFFGSIVIGAAARRFIHLKEKMTGEKTRSSKSRTKKN